MELLRSNIQKGHVTMGWNCYPKPHQHFQWEMWKFVGNYLTVQQKRLGWAGSGGTTSSAGGAWVSPADGVSSVFVLYL